MKLDGEISQLLGLALRKYNLIYWSKKKTKLKHKDGFSKPGEN